MVNAQEALSPIWPLPSALITKGFHVDHAQPLVGDRIACLVQRGCRYDEAGYQECG
jgi:hypothetical protein